MTNEEIDEICDEINNLTCKRQSLLLKGKAVSNTDQSIADLNNQINKLTNMLTESDLNLEIQNEQREKGNIHEVNREDDKPEKNSGTLEQIKGSGKKENRFYAVIPKDFAEKEIPELLEQFPGHIFYALEIIEDDEVQKVQIILNNEKQVDNIAYYPALDDAGSDEERRKIMDDFLEDFPEKYHYVRMQDVFQ